MFSLSCKLRHRQLWFQNIVPPLGAQRVVYLPPSIIKIIPPDKDWAVLFAARMKNWSSVNSDFLSWNAHPLYDHHRPGWLHVAPMGLREQENQHEQELYPACFVISNSFLL